MVFEGLCAALTTVSKSNVAKPIRSYESLTEEDMYRRQGQQSILHHGKIHRHPECLKGSESLDHSQWGKSK